MITTTLRYCRDCGKRKHDKDFYGKATLCKPCAKDYQHNYYWKNVRVA